MMYEVKDVVLTHPEFGGRQFGIVCIRDGKYYAVAIKGRKRYWLEEDQIQEKVGVLPDDSPILLLDDAYEPAIGKEYAEDQGRLAGADKARWAILAALKPGDAVDVFHKKFIHRAVFVQVNVGKPRLVFRARILDVAHDLPLQAISVEGKP